VKVILNVGFTLFLNSPNWKLFLVFYFSSRGWFKYHSISIKVGWVFCVKDCSGNPFLCW